MGPRPRIVAVLAGLLAATAVSASAGCAADPPVTADVVTIEQAPTVARAAPPAVAAPAPELPAPEPQVEPGAAPAELIAAIEEQVVTRANEARAAAGLAPLARMAELDAVARAWSAQLAAEGRQLDHNPDYSSQIPSGWSVAGENVGWIGQTRIVPAEEVVGPVHQGWMDSAGHRENLLKPEYTQIGVGVAFSPGRGYYLTQNFAAY